MKEKKEIKWLLLCLGALMLFLAGCKGKQAETMTTAAIKEQQSMETELEQENEEIIKDDGWVKAYQELAAQDFYSGCYMYLHDMGNDATPELLMAAPARNNQMLVIPVYWDAVEKKAVEDTEQIQKLGVITQGDFSGTLLGYVDEYSQELWQKGLLSESRIDLENDTFVLDSKTMRIQEQRFLLDDENLVTMFDEKTSPIPWRTVDEAVVSSYISTEYAEENQKNAWYWDGTGRRFRMENGEDAVDAWIEYNNDYYRMGRDGYMLTEWYEEEGNKYYLSPMTYNETEEIHIECGSRLNNGWFFVGNNEYVSFDKDGVAFPYGENPLREFEIISPEMEVILYLKNLEKKDGYYELTGAVEAIGLKKDWVESLEVGDVVEIPGWQYSVENEAMLNIKKYKAKVTWVGNEVNLKVEGLAGIDNLTRDSNQEDWEAVMNIPYSNFCLSLSEDGKYYYLRPDPDPNLFLRIQSGEIYVEDIYTNGINLEEYSVFPGSYPLIEDAVFIADAKTECDNGMMELDEYFSALSEIMEQSKQLRAGLTPDTLEELQGSAFFYPQRHITVFPSNNHLKKITR